MKKANMHAIGWTRRQRDIWGFVATIALSAVILSGGFMASAWMEKLVPSFIGRTVYTDKTDVAGPVFSYNDNIRTFLTPWNLYDANHVHAISEKEREVLGSWGDMDGFIDYLLPASLKGASMVDKFVVSDGIEEDNGILTCFFLKDASATLSNNQTVRIDCSIQSSFTNNSLYFYYRPDGEAETVSKEVLDEAYQKLQKMLSVFESKNNVKYSETDQEVMDAYYTQLEKVMTSIANIAEAIDKFIYTDIQTIVGDFLLYDIFYSMFEILRTDNELLLVFSIDERRVIYFIEPINLQFRGFSLQM